MVQTAQRHTQPWLGHPSHQADAPEIRLLGRCEVALREVTIALTQKLQVPTVGVNVTRALRRGFVDGYDPETGKPFSTRQLVACYHEGARRFGWDQRPTRPARRP